jgi:hypothetical protein
MQPANVRIFIATDDIESIGARKGQFVLDDGGLMLCVMHEVPRVALNGCEALLKPVPSTHPRAAAVAVDLQDSPPQLPE